MAGDRDVIRFVRLYITALAVIYTLRFYIVIIDVNIIVYMSSRNQTLLVYGTLSRLNKMVLL